MDSVDLITRFRILIPDVRVSIWEAEGDYFGETEPLIRFGMKVDWKSPGKCPTEEELSAITEKQIQNFLQEEQDMNLYNQYKDDITMKAMFNFSKQNNPDLTFMEFIKSIQNSKV